MYYLCKIEQYILGKLGLNCPLVPLLKVIKKSHLSCNTTIHLDAKFQFLGICCSRLYPKEIINFFVVQDPIGPIFGDLRAMPLVKSVKLRYFDHRSFSQLYKYRVKHFENLEFLQRQGRAYSKFELTTVYSLKMVEIKPSGYPNLSKWKPYLL